MNMNKLLYPILSMPLALFSACAYDDSYEEHVSTTTDVTEIADRYYYRCDSLTVVCLPQEVRSIGDLAFFGSSITSLSIPSQVGYIGTNAFNFCTNLTTIQIDESNSVFDSRNNCNAIIRSCDDKLVYGCVATVIPSTVSSIADYAFCGCEGLAELVLPDNIEQIGTGAFSECSGLTSVTLSAGMSHISTLAFADCPDLAEVTLPQGLRSVGDGAFLHCPRLQAVHVQSITPPQCGYIAFFNTTATLYVPHGSRDAYAASYGWCDFKMIVEE